MKLYFIFCLLVTLIMFVNSCLVGFQIKREYPELLEKYKLVRKKSKLEDVFELIKILVYCFIPIINFAILYTSIFCEDQVKDISINRMKKVVDNNSF